ncbi:MAG: HTH-type transcriptional regulator MalT [Burkholderiaceae bacterium]|nr:HTH-type transcriptional regulator MalT [Burkholderiaceae bacterium]
MPADAATVLQQAREAYARRAWADALALFQQADAATPLEGSDLERLAWSAGLVDRDADLLAGFERLFEAAIASGAVERAAYWAFFHGFRLHALRETGRAAAWLQRAQRLVDGLAQDCVVAGYLLLPPMQRQLAAGDHAGAAATAARALDVGERFADPDLVALARCGLGRALARQGQVERGVSQLDEAMLVAVGGAMSPLMTGLVYCNLIATCRQIYALDRSREWTEALSRWCERQPQLIQFNGLCLLHRAEILEMNGAWHDAVAEAHRATHSAARALAAETEAAAAYQEAEVHRLRGEFDLAEEGYRTASRLGLDPQPGMALLRLAQGRSDAAAAMWRRVLAATADPLGRARLLPAGVEILCAAGALPEAREACAELAAIATRFATEILQALAQQACAEVDLVDGRCAGALQGFRAAFAVWQRTHAPYIEARLRMRAGQACRALGDEDGALLEFEAAGAVFERLGAAPDLAQVRALGSNAGSASRRAHDKLTPREVEVLGLIAAGHSNKRIASALGLSAKTVDRHVSNIFDKLAVSSRAAATAYAFQHRLL